MWSIITLTIPAQAQAPLKLVRIAVIDTGYNVEFNTLKLCNKGLDFTGTGLNDNIGHGNNVAHIIANRLTDLNYCIYPIKVFDVDDGIFNLKRILQGLHAAYKFKPDIINLSYGGTGEFVIEWLYIKFLLDKNITIVAAAGNLATNLDKKCNYFPACYDDRIITVGNLNESGKRQSKSNYGHYVKKWNVGTNVFAGGYSLTGTSQATAIETANQALLLLK